MWINRRNFLASMAGGFGTVALADQLDPFAAKPPHFAPKAKHIIYLVMNGGMSQVDTFDPKPALDKYHGQAMPGEQVKTERITGSLMRSPFSFKKYGQSGMEVSTLFPHLAQHVDDLCFVRSFYTDSTVHAPAMYQVNTGRILMGYPSMGSWITYGLGSENENLPGFVVMLEGSIVGVSGAKNTCGTGDVRGNGIVEQNTVLLNIGSAVVEEGKGERHIGLRFDFGGLCYDKKLLEQRKRIATMVGKYPKLTNAPFVVTICNGSITCKASLYQNDIGVCQATP